MIKDDLVALLSQLEMSVNKEGSKKLGTGLREFDQRLHHFNPGDLITIGSRPGMGATALGISILNNFSTAGRSCFYYSNESNEAMTQRLISINARIRLTNLYSGKLSDRDWGSLARSADELSKKEIQFKQRGRFFRDPNESRMEGPEVAIFDHVYQSVEELYHFQTCNPKTLIFMFIPVSDQIDGRPNKRPLIKDIEPESKYLAALSEAVCFLYRDEYYNRESEDKGIGELIIVKNRRGESQTVRLVWISEYNAWVNLQSGEAKDGLDKCMEP